MSSATTAPSSLDELVERYNKAWNDHDLDGILALHTAEPEFLIHGAQELMKWVGRDECRSCFEYLIDAWPDYHMVAGKPIIRDSVYVCSQMLTGTLVKPWKMAGRTYEPIGKPVTFEIIDVMHCEGNLIAVKDSWLDGLAIHNQLTAAA